MIGQLTIRKIVDDLIDTHETRDPFRLCQYLGAIVVYVPLVRVNGFYQRYNDNDLIYINEDLSEEEQTLVCAHELGHLILHSDLNAIFLESTYFVASRYETEANMFAEYLLSKLYEDF